MFCCFISGIKRCLALHFNTTTPDTMQHTILHSFSPTTASKFSPGLLCSKTSTQTNTPGTIGETCSRQSERPCKCVCVCVCVNCFRHSDMQEWVAIQAHVIHNPIQCMHQRCYAFEDSRGGTDPLLIMCVSLSRKIPRGSTNS